MNNLDLYEYAETENIIIEKRKIPKNKSLSLKIGNKEYIGLDVNIVEDSAEERTRLAHELGHCATCAFYDIDTPLSMRKRCEHKANRWAIINCIPKNELIALLKKGYQQNEIAEYFGVTEKMILIAYTYYFEYGIVG